MAVPTGAPTDDGYAPTRVTNVTVINDATGIPVQVLEYLEGGAIHTTNLTFTTQS